MDFKLTLSFNLLLTFIIPALIKAQTDNSIRAYCQNSSGFLNIVFVRKFNKMLLDGN